MRPSRTLLGVVAVLGSTALFGCKPKVPDEYKTLVPEENLSKVIKLDKNTPFDKGAYASSTTFITGQSVKKAAEGVRRQLEDAYRSMWDRR